MSNIIFREINYEDDIDEIISLLNKSFTSDHNKKKFIWKHFKNPFGKSYGLLAIDNNSIIGLRMFMRWEFKKDDRIIKAIRPVDTCTHPEFQGQGIFKRLTLTGLENIKDEYDLIFNTPNEKSRSGYLKMGWEEIEKENQYKLGFVNIFNSVYDFKIIPTITEINSSYLNINCSTNLTTDYLKWRYSNDNYNIAKFKDGAIVVYKISKVKGLKTLVLFEIFGETVKFSTYITSICLKKKLILIYYLNTNKNINLNLFLNFNRSKQVVLFKNDELKIINCIQFSLTDLEGKL